MKRRHFLKATGAFTVASAAPSFFNLPGLISSSAAAQLEAANFIMPDRLPQVINIFMYGGASELAGNLTNIPQINAASQNLYPDELLTNATPNNDGQITQNRFWRNAGGIEMEDMLAAGDMSVYRTINRLKDNTRAHRQSIFSSQKGSLNIDGSPGMGSTIAAVLEANKSSLNGSSQLNGKTLEQLVLPFVSFEGSSVAFSPDEDRVLPLQMRGLSLDEEFNNPYSRSYSSHDSEIDALIEQVVNDVQRARFAKIQGGFALRRQMETLIGGLQRAADNPLPIIPASSTADPDADADTGRLRYPDNNRFSARIRAAVTLALENQDTMFISLGGGLGSWDDHDSSLEEYAPRMQQLMAAIRAATKHIKYSDIAYGGSRDTGNIVINVHGDFGRNVNLNNSAGWDHGNNQNLYTFMGHSIRPAGALGKIVGETEIFGSASNNRLYTRPTDSSYQAEPMSIAATTYKYFGVNNPRVLTMDSVYNPEGDAALDETVPGVG
ncbi:MAG: DUF1501 domain-containing protein [Gammaproteobacteria bacterium]|nr:DUF1501 domain-containing protein [Gammaproteobacteria bacterium]